MGKNLIYKIVHSSIFLLLFISIGVNAQVGIGTTNPAGMLDVTSTNDGFLLPRVALTGTTSASPLTTPAISEMVYNTATVADVVPGFYYWNGTKWVPLLFGNLNSWSTLGNSGTTTATNFIGTTDAVDFVTKTNNTEKMRVTSAGNIGIGTSSPANKLEITQGTAGNSGLRFTNLNSASTASTSSSKVLGLNSTGDVILTNVPGTQNIVDFSTATPTTSGVVFTPNTPSDESVVYQSAVDNSLWTYNGTTYVTYTAPPSTAWFTAGTTNDAGNSKTSNIYRTGRMGIGTNNPANNLDVVGGFNLRNTAGSSGSNYGIEFNSNSNAPRIDWVFNGGYIGQFASDANNFILQNSKLSTGGFRFMTNPGTGALDRLNILNNGNIGIGTTSPANKLEITQGTAGNSGLRFTNLNSASTASTSSSKVLGLNSTGDVILTNVPGTQNIVDFSTATPTTSGVVFTPNTPLDESVVYQSAVDNSLWTYNGTTYVTYTAPASTAWNLANTNNDAGSNKSANIWRSGNVGIGTNNPLTTLQLTNSLTATASVNANAQVLRLTRPTTPSIKWDNIAQFNLGSYSTAIAANSRLDLALTDGGNATNLSNVMTWQANGNVGIRNTAPTATLDVNSITVASNTVNADVTVLKLARPLNSGVKFNNIAHFNLGSFTTGGQANSRLDLNLSNINDTDIPNVMTWQANGNVGINNTAPSAPLVVQGVSGTGTLKLIAPVVNGSGDNWWMGFGHGTTSTDANDRARIGVDILAGGAGRLFFTTGISGSQTRAMFIDQNQRVGIGTSNPNSKLEVISGNTEVARLTTSLTTNNYAGIGIGNGTGVWAKLAAGDSKFQIRNFSTEVSVLHADLLTGNVGIGTTNPASKFEVNGSATNTAAHNNGAANAIAFSLSNLAYTSLSAQSFNLTGMKDGGTYTLAVQGTTSGTSSFTGVNPSGTAFVFKSINNGTTIAGKETLYTFVVMGTTVYVYMATGF